MRILLVFLFAAFAALSNTNAQTTKHRVKIRQVKQNVRIAHGTVNGELTRRERKKLKRQQRHINRTKKRAAADGHVSAREKAKINRKQNRANRNIRRKKNNAVKRY